VPETNFKSKSLLGPTGPKKDHQVAEKVSTVAPHGPQMAPRIKSPFGLLILGSWGLLSDLNLTPKCQLLVKGDGIALDQVAPHPYAYAYAYACTVSCFPTVRLWLCLCLCRHCVCQWRHLCLFSALDVNKLILFKVYVKPGGKIVCRWERSFPVGKKFAGGKAVRRWEKSLPVRNWTYKSLISLVSDL